MKSHPVYQFMRKLFPRITTLLWFFGDKFHYEKVSAMTLQEFLKKKMTASIQKASNRKALQIGFRRVKCEFHGLA